MPRNTKHSSWSFFPIPEREVRKDGSSDPLASGGCEEGSLKFGAGSLSWN